MASNNQLKHYDSDGTLGYGENMIAPVKLLGESYCLLHDFYPAKDYLEKHKLLLEMSKMALYTIQYHYNDIIFNGLD